MVFPTPPFWFATVITRHFEGRGHSPSFRVEYPTEGAAAGAAVAVSRETTELSASRTSGESPGLRGVWDTVVVLSPCETEIKGQPTPDGRPTDAISKGTAM
ncbi:hypothetical protein Misp02_51110 [Microtetraspora sp. NBRC 16547]|nr:hypothetical protein Misp02_51110 [Microtetraspora sp. NBRC 16547]